MYSEEMKDIYPVIMEQLSTADIISLCQVSSKFKDICHSNKKYALIMKLSTWLNDEYRPMFIELKKMDVKSKYNVTKITDKYWVQYRSKDIDSILIYFEKWKKSKEQRIEYYINYVILPRLNLPTSSTTLLGKQQEGERRIQDLYKFYQEYLKI